MYIYILVVACVIINYRRPFRHSQFYNKCAGYLNSCVYNKSMINLLIN